MEEKFAMGLREAASAIGLSYWTLVKMVREGLPVVRINRRVLVEPETLRRLVEEGRTRRRVEPRVEGSSSEGSK